MLEKSSSYLMDTKFRNEEVIKLIAPNITLEAMVLKQKLTYFGHDGMKMVWEEITEEILCLVKQMDAGEEEDSVEDGFESPTAPEEG